MPYKDNEVCSNCRRGFMYCRCEQYHPPITKSLELTEDEVCSLIDYFYHRAGYISPEFDMKVLNLIKRMDEFVK